MEVGRTVAIKVASADLTRAIGDQIENLLGSRAISAANGLRLRELAANPPINQVGWMPPQNDRMRGQPACFGLFGMVSSGGSHG